MVWIQKTQHDNKSKYDNISINLTKILACYIWLLLIFLSCIHIFRKSKRLIANVMKDNNEAFQARLDIARKQVFIVFGYSFFWFVVFLFQILENMKKLPSGLWKMIPVLLLSSRGLLTLGITLINNWSEIRLCKSYKNLSWKEAIASSDLEPHVNTKLRSEIILYTKAGIMISINDESKRSFIASKNLSRSTFDSVDFHFFQFKDRGSANSYFTGSLHNNRPSSSKKVSLDEGLIDELLTTEEFEFLENRQRTLVEPDVDRMIMDLIKINQDETEKEYFKRVGKEDNNKAMKNKSNTNDVESSFNSSLVSSIYKLNLHEGVDWIKTENNYKKQSQELSNDNNILNEYEYEDENNDKKNQILSENSSKVVSKDSLNLSDARKFSVALFAKFKRKPVDHAFEAHLPSQFNKIRKLSFINDDEYVKSFQNVTQEIFSEGKSGSFLYFSR